jgi:hypothetical protein
MLIEYAIYKVEQVWTPLEKWSFAFLFMALGWCAGSVASKVIPLASAVFYSGPIMFAP